MMITKFKCQLYDYHLYCSSSNINCLKCCYVLFLRGSLVFPLVSSNCFGTIENYGRYKNIQRTYDNISLNNFWKIIKMKVFL